MNRGIKILVLAAAGLLALTAGPARAQTTTGTFDVQATIPKAVSVTFVVSEVKQTPGPNPGDPPIIEFTKTTEGIVPLNFDTAGEGMTYDSANNIWTATRFFAIDLSPRDGGGNPAPAVYDNVQLSFTPGSKPAGQSVGLEKKATITAVKVSGSPAVETDLISARNIGAGLPTINGTDISGGFLRIYVGLATGETTGSPPVPVVPGSEPFTNADQPGTYTGQLTVTATLM